jgi:hypothetical protein
MAEVQINETGVILNEDGMKKNLVPQNVIEAAILAEGVYSFSPGGMTAKDAKHKRGDLNFTLTNLSAWYSTISSQLSQQVRSIEACFPELKKK